MVKLNRRITVRAWGFTQDIIGGIVKAETGAWTMWAQVDERSGGSFRDHNQMIWDYDYKVTVRYENSRVIGSNNTLDYGDYLLKINNTSIKNEGFHKYLEMRCSTVDDNTATGGGGSVTPLPQIRVYTYTGIGGEYGFTALAGKTVFGVFKDGIAYDIITTGTPDSAKKEVLITAGLVFTFAFPFYAGETCNVQYIN
jgi:SPP1 family predicted phage head-tail adaptor